MAPSAAVAAAVIEISAKYQEPLTDGMGIILIRNDGQTGKESGAEK